MGSSTPVMIHLIRDVCVVNFNTASILEAAEIQHLGTQLYDLVDGQAHRKIILDFSKVKSLSSSALGILINLQKKIESIKGRIVICGLRKDLKRPFEIARIDRLFTFSDDEDQALAALGVSTSG